VQSINPQAKLGIGPPIADGFYYDFDVAEPFTPEDLKKIEKEMERIIRSGQRFVRKVVSEDEARSQLSAEPYKLELISLKGSGDLAEGSAEVGAGELTIYHNTDAKSGETIWKDLCRGPHLPNTRMIGNGFSLTRLAAAYWRGNEKNKMLKRIYGITFPKQKELEEYLHMLEEAKKRDHRKLGKELELFASKFIRRPVGNKLVIVGVTLAETDSILDPPEFTAFNLTLYVVPFVKRVTPSDESVFISTGL
jgi:threonyl-tRNA synthetase